MFDEEFDYYCEEQDEVYRNRCKVQNVLRFCVDNARENFCKIITGAKEADEQSMLIYGEFADLCVQHVVGRIKMSGMGMNRPKNARKQYKDLVTISDEAFALLVLEDRWELWKAIYTERKRQRKSLLDGDEDDQREVDEDTGKKKNGSNLTIYSYHGTMAPNFKGFDPDAATKRQNEFFKEIKKFRETANGKRVLDHVGKYYGGNVGKGPKMDKGRKRRSLVQQSEVEEEMTEL